MRTEIIEKIVLSPENCRDCQCNRLYDMGTRGQCGAVLVDLERLKQCPRKLF